MLCAESGGCWVPLGGLWLSVVEWTDGMFGSMMHQEACTVFGMGASVRVL